MGNSISARRASDTRVPTLAAPAAVQILSILAYAGFAISVSIVAMAMFGILGLGLAFFMAYQWMNIPAMAGTLPDKIALPSLGPIVPEPSSGNASFDSYRREMLDRLDAERLAFGDFMEKLREARDKDEFDRFMTDRREDQAPA